MEHAVIVHLILQGGPMGSPREREEIFAFESRLEAAIERAGAGEFDGNEFGNHECVLYMYGPNADRLFTAIEPILRAAPQAAGGYALKRYGDATDPSARESRVRW